MIMDLTRYRFFLYRRLNDIGIKDQNVINAMRMHILLLIQRTYWPKADISVIDTEVIIE